MKRNFPAIDLSYYSNKHMPVLDGLRGLAIILVMLRHCFPVVPTLSGWVGVDLFFVLSGFLITGILLNTRESPGYYVNFLGRRMLRIFPLYYLVLLLVFNVLPLINKDYTGSSFNYYINHQEWFWSYTQNWLYSIEGFPENGTLVHFWSLAVEEQFYLIWPWVVMLCTRKRLLAVCVCLCVAANCFRLMPASWLNLDNIFRYVATFSRMDALLMGAMVAILIRDMPGILKKSTLPAFISASIILFGVGSYLKFYIHSTKIYPLYTFLDIFFGCILVFSLCKNYLHTIFSNRILIFFGKYSYGLYIYHLIILSIIEYNFHEFIYQDITRDPTFTMWIFALSTWSLSIVISWVSYNFFEIYFLRLKRFFPYLSNTDKEQGVPAESRPITIPSEIKQ